MRARTAGLATVYLPEVIGCCSDLIDKLIFPRLADNEQESYMSIGDKPTFDDGRTIVPSHHPMPGVDDDVIDVGRKTGVQLPPAKEGQEEKHIDWDDRESSASDAPDAADIINPSEAGRG
jgi:hypothetical protein